MDKIHIKPKKERITNIVTVILLIAVFIISVNAIDLEWEKFFTRIKDFPEVASSFMTLDFTDFGKIILALTESIVLGLVALVIGAAISFVFAFLGASNTGPSKVLSAIIKGVVAIIRAIPSLVWSIIIIASIGFGNTAGLVAIIAPTVGYLVKSFIGSIEEIPGYIIETLASTGANMLQIIKEGIMPTVKNDFLSWISIRLEGNIGHSISLGAVGAGGIGMLLNRAISMYQYGRISLILVLILITMYPKFP